MNTNQGGNEMNFSTITYTYKISSNESVYISESVQRKNAYSSQDSTLFQTEITWTLVHEFDGEQDIVDTYDSLSCAYQQVNDSAESYVNTLLV
jgi:hypothetical protein